MVVVVVHSGAPSELATNFDPKVFLQNLQATAYARCLEDAGGTAHPEDLSPAVLLPSLGSTSTGVVSSIIAAARAARTVEAGIRSTLDQERADDLKKFTRPDDPGVESCLGGDARVLAIASIPVPDSHVQWLDFHPPVHSVAKQILAAAKSKPNKFHMMGKLEREWESCHVTMMHRECPAILGPTQAPSPCSLAGMCTCDTKCVAKVARDSFVRLLSSAFPKGELREDLLNKGRVVVAFDGVTAPSDMHPECQLGPRVFFHLASVYWKPISVYLHRLQHYVGLYERPETNIIEANLRFVSCVWSVVAVPPHLCQR